MTRATVCVQAPDCSVVGTGEKVLLFRHRPASEQLLLRLTDGDELQEGDLIEVVIAGQRSMAWLTSYPGWILIAINSHFVSKCDSSSCFHCFRCCWSSFARCSVFVALVTLIHTGCRVDVWTVLLCKQTLRSCNIQKQNDKNHQQPQSFLSHRVILIYQDSF